MYEYGYICYVFCTRSVYVIKYGMELYGDNNNHNMYVEEKTHQTNGREAKSWKKEEMKNVGDTQSCM